MDTLFHKDHTQFWLQRNERFPYTHAFAWRWVPCSVSYQMCMIVFYAVARANEWRDECLTQDTAGEMPRYPVHVPLALERCPGGQQPHKTQPIHFSSSPSSAVCSGSVRTRSSCRPRACPVSIVPAPGADAGAGARRRGGLRDHRVHADPAVTAPACALLGAVHAGRCGGPSEYTEAAHDEADCPQPHPEH